MALTNAERQKRHRTRLRDAVKAGGVLPSELVADREAVIGQPLYPVPDVAARDNMPTFLGWNRYDWSAAPEPLIDFFGMRAAWEGWRGENTAMEDRMAEISRERTAAADAIVAECGQVATDILRSGGQVALFAAYKANPTLGQKRRKRQAVT